jgi:hypothetical protein
MVMLQTSCNAAVQKAVLAQIAKGGYQLPAIASLKLESVGKCGPLAMAGNSTQVPFN